MKRHRGKKTLEPKQQLWCPVRFTMALPEDVGSALYDVIWEKGESNAVQLRTSQIQNAPSR